MHYCFVPDYITTIPNFDIQKPSTISKGTLMGRQHEDTVFKNIVFLGFSDVLKSSTYKTLLINYSHSHSIFSCDISSAPKLEKSDFGQNKFLMQRYNLIEEAKNAEIIGIVMGTLSLSGETKARPDLLLKHLISSSGKKAYELLIGKLNEPKIMNFTTIDLFVVVACRENSIYYSRQFGKPILTPYELCIALDGGIQWDGRISTEITKAFSKLDVQELKNKSEQWEEENAGELMKVEGGGQVISYHALERFREMTFTGLELVEDTTPAPLENGKFGIATSYTQIE
jgi:hypothetical protein